MIASAQTLREFKELIIPFFERTKAFGMTYGLGPAGYDIRIGEDLFIPPGGFILGSALEKFNIPYQLLGIVHDKSTWARLGLAVQNTVLEPGWRGYPTIELSNHSSQILSIKRGMPICQVIFHILDKPTNIPYDGKYQDQKSGVQHPIFEK